MNNDDALLNNRGPQPGAETVYGTEDNNMVMSEKNEEVVSIVQQLAGSIYQEFERMINRYDEDVVKNLMPLLVNVLECLDASYRINQEQDVELELLREDNEQLVTQYEREKSARKQAEQKLLETEDIAEAENKDLSNRLESLESIVRMLELKHKNSLEHASRLEERESDLKKEYARLHERYTELFKNHVDYMERTKMLMGSTHSQMSSASERLDVNRARLNPIARSSGPVSYGFASLENSAMLDTETICSVGSNSDDSGPPSLHNELDSLQTMERAAETDTLQQHNQATSPQSDIPSPVVPNSAATVGRSTTKKEQRSANTLYQELSFQDNEESEEHEVVTGSWVHPGEYASSANDNYFGMGKEVENLIMENNELLATKNALNIVKDDLIVKVDELTGEIEILREELNAMQQSRNKLRQKVSELEDELKKTKEQVKQQNENEQEENDVPYAQRKRFTRVEMAMVLMERNQYKERLMELQEAVRLTEILRASRNVENLDKKSKQSVWKYFSSLFSPSNRPQERVSDGQGGGPMFRYSPSHSHGSPSRSSDNRLAITGRDPPLHPASAGLANALIAAKDYADEGTSERVNARRRDQYRQLRAHVPKEDGRLHAYGWSLPINKANQDQSNRNSSGVPVPVYCNPLAEASPHMKIFCAAGVNLNGGFTKDGQCVIPSTSVYAPRSIAKIAEITSPSAEHSAEALDRQISRASLEILEPETQLSSFVWICTSAHGASTVTVVDANQSANVLDAFPICSSHLLCIASVQGAMENDYALLENSEVIKAGEMLERPGEGTEMNGKVEFVRVRPKSDKNSNTKDNSMEEQGQEMHAEAENAKEATEKSNEATETVEGSAMEPLGNVNEIKIRHALPGAPQRVQTSVTDNSGNDVNEGDNDGDGNGDGGNNNNNNNNNNATTATPSTASQILFSKPINPILDTKDRQDPPMSSVGPTMWLGAQNGWIYVHSSVGRWHECLHKIHLPDAVLAIVYVESRVVVALASAQLAVFRRQTDGQWDLNSYHLVTLGDRNHAIRCLCIAGERIWAAHRNKIYVVDPISLNIIHSLEAHPRKESQVRQMAATGSGVWVSIRLDSTLRLYNTNTFEHKQDVDIEPYVSKMLGTGKLGFSFVRITALMVSCNRLWIGTSNGVIISVPLSEQTTVRSSDPNGQIPLCCMANSQLSFHGHRDAVKFFVSVPMQPQSSSQLQFSNKRPDMLVMCGGEGYIDFRIRQEKPIADESDYEAHLIVWRVNTSKYSNIYAQILDDPKQTLITQLNNLRKNFWCRDLVSIFVLGDNDMENSIHLESNQTIENRGDKSFLIVWHVSQR